MLLHIIYELQRLALSLGSWFKALWDTAWCCPATNRSMTPHKKTLTASPSLERTYILPEHSWLKKNDNSSEQLGWSIHPSPKPPDTKCAPHTSPLSCLEHMHSWSRITSDARILFFDSIYAYHFALVKAISLHQCAHKECLHGCH